jgi:hypothetical protein
MKTILPNERAYDKVGDHSLFSAEHCCICGRPTLPDNEWLLLTRAADGACEFAISYPSDASADEIRSGLWVAPIGSECMLKHPELRHAKVATATRVAELETTLHSIDALILKEGPVESIQLLTSVERRVLRMIEVAFGVQ